MNCHLSRLLLAFRPDELAGDDRAALDAHLRTCPACAAAAKTETAADNALRSAMLAVPVPTGLRAKLHASATATQGAAWRRKATRWAGGVLAASLVVTLFGIGVSYFTQPTFSTTELSNRLDVERLSKEQTVNAWLASEGVPPLPPLPRSFEYAYHVAHGTGPVLDGINRPFVLFQNGPHQCRVYIFRAGSVKAPADGWKDVTGSEFTITTVEKDGWVYVIAYTSPTLEPFLKPLGPLA